ncbi:MAG: tetratricopeptide repeat protein [Bacteroidales bacterium]|nr:tetratricopeptide repeat protein [Bacteroidales bacterium]
MKYRRLIGLLLLLALTACDATTRDARRMVKRAERLADTLPDSTVRLIDSVLRMPAGFSERERMDMALLQAEALFGDRGQEISPVMDDDFFDDHDNLSTSPELERAAAYYASKKEYAHAAHAALYSGFVQQHYNEKEIAMRSFKEAEYYGGLAGDSLTMAQAEYWMGKGLYSDEMEEEAVTLLLKAFDNFGYHYAGKALTQNLLASCYIILNQYEKAEISLNSSMYFAEKAQISTLKVHILNNHAVLCRLQKRYDDALMYLRQIVCVSNLSETELFVYYLNIGKTFSAANEMDSTMLYFKHVEDLLPNTNIKKESRISAFGALSRFAKQQSDFQTTWQYNEQREELMSELLVELQQQAIYRTQQQFDYESLQNEMNKKLIQKQYFITFIGIFAIIGLTALTISQIHLAKIRKHEAETNANLFHFMQQNKTLVESNMAQERMVLDTTQKLSDMLHEKFKTMQKLSFSIENPKNKIALKDLKKVVFGEREHWEAVREVLDALYPGLWETITLRYPEMNEMEHRVLMLSRFKLSRMEEAALLGISTSVLDKLRTKVRKMVELDKKQ